MKRLILSLVFALAAIQLSLSQPFSYHWATGFGGRAQYSGKVDMVYSDFGLLYMTGDFTGTRLFGTTNKTAVGYSDMYVTMVDTGGTVQWVVTGGSMFSYAYASAIVRDNSSNTYVVGHFTGTFSIGAFTEGSAGQNDIYIAKLDFAGNPVWLKRAGGSSFDEAKSIYCDGNSLYITGYFTNAATFGTVNLTSSGTNDQEIYLAKYDLNGTCLWAKSAGGTGEERGNSILKDIQGNVAITGEFSGVASFGSNSVTSSAFSDLFVAKYDDSGNNIWVKRGGGSSSDIGISIGFDQTGNYYVCGNYTNTAGFGLDSVYDNGYGNVFMTKLNASGAFQWAKGGGSASGDGVFDMSVNRKDGNCYLTGFLNGSGFFSGTSIPSSGLNDAFILRYNNAGTVMFGLNIGGNNYDQGKTIAADEGGGVVYVGGEYTGSVSIGTNTLPVPPPSVWYQYVARISTGTVGVQEHGFASSAMQLFPNPAHDFMSVMLDDEIQGEARIEVTDVSGRQVYSASEQLNGKVITIPVSAISAGRYTLSVKHGNAEIHSGFVVID